MDECMTYEISTDEIRSYLPELHAGDRVLLSGRIYTSRDAAHKLHLRSAGQWLSAAL